MASIKVKIPRYSVTKHGRIICTGTTIKTIKVK